MKYLIPIFNLLFIISIPEAHAEYIQSSPSSGAGGASGNQLSGVVTTPSNTSGVTSFGTFSSSTLASALSDETGTGPAVFANSPVFTTPNIGSATGSITGNAGTVTNGLYSTGSYSNPSWLTGVPYSILTGTVPTWNQNTTGNAATVTTNANLTGAIVSTGNATSLGTASITSAQLAAALTNGTGTGSNVFANSPTLVTPNIGTATGSITGNAATVTTNANLTGVITSVGNATSTGSQTGTGNTFVMSVSPSLTTPSLGFASASGIAQSGGYTGATWTTKSPVFSIASQTLADTTGSGAITTKGAYTLQAPTFTSTSVQTVQNLSTLYVETSIAGANVTGTNLYAIYATGYSFLSNLGTGAMTASGLAQLSSASIYGGGSPALTVTGSEKVSTFYLQSVGTAIASATTITPVAQITHVTGTTAIATITPPTGTSATVGACITLIADGAWSTTTAGNIFATMTATVGTRYSPCFDGSKWIF